MKDNDLQIIKMSPIGWVRRTSPDEDTRDRSLLCQIVLAKELADAADGLDDWSHVYVIYWLSDVPRAPEPTVHFPAERDGAPPLGILATRAPIHPNPIGLTLVELVKREKNVLQVRGLDAYDGTPILDIKPYPDWERGRFIVVTDFRAPEWVREIVQQESPQANPRPPGEVRAPAQP
jgi:tRNA-Thr(GGU) m(6)t(6)A37 methyltransferase TsaA